jgi:apolipoprotein N-acyltransferase
VNTLRLKFLFLAVLAGILTVAGFAPWGIFPLPIFTLALLFWLWNQAKTAAHAAAIGFAFGLGLFGAGIGWIYIALNQFGEMPPALAFLATLLFVSFYALFPALVGLLQAKLSLPRWLKNALLLPIFWVTSELLRGYLFSGFPWLVLGYSQVPNSPLAGFAPILGVYAVSLVLAICAGLLIECRKIQGLLPLILLIVLGAGLQKIVWTQPIGATTRVSLLQGNIAQDEKFAEGQLDLSLNRYQTLIEQSKAQLIVLPETALPLLRSELPSDYREKVSQYARNNHADVLIGGFEAEDGKIYNAMYSLGISENQTYRKNHLVPFGEFIPLRSVFGWLINDLLNIPMSDQSSGGTEQALLQLAGQKIAMNICFEDGFGEEIIRRLPQATLLLNTSNDAWYGESSAAIQHNQISQMRALETGRMMLRATNTGVTSVIDRDGKVVQQLAEHNVGILNADIQGYAGTTPYVRWGNNGIFALLLILFGLVFALRTQKIKP